MFLLKGLIASMSKLLSMSLVIIVCGMGGTGAFAATTANVETIQTAVTAYQTIGTLRRESPINGDAIATAYAGALQTLVQEVDTANKLKLDSDILVAIEEIKDGNEPSLAAQVVDKTLQRVFYQVVFNRMTDIRSQFESATSAELVRMLDEMVASFQAISANVARANQVLSADKQSIVEGSNPAADVAFNESVARIRVALNKSNPEEDAGVVAVERYVTRISSLARAYYNAVLREVAGAMESRNADIEEMRKELKEGEVFYRTIETLVARDNPVGNALIKAQLTGDGSDLVADDIVSALNKGMLGRSRGEMANIATAENRVGRMAEASGTVEFAKIFMPDLELRLGATVRGNLETALNDLNSAAKANDTAKSTAAQAAITAIFDSYENELKLVEYDVSSNTALVDNAVSRFQTIGDLIEQDPIDAGAIAAAYSGELLQVTQFIDQIYGLTIDQDILAAIESIRNGNEVSLAAERIDKSLQRVFAIGIYDRVTSVVDNFDNLTTDELALEWDRAHSAFVAVTGTAAKENKVLTADKQTFETGSNPNLDDQITLAFVNGRQALNKANADDRVNIALARENVIIPLVRSFLIGGVLGEVGELITNRDGDVDAARKEQVEAELFYRTVDVFIAQDNPTGSNRIKTQLAGDLTNIVANEIMSEISKGIIGQLNRSIQLIESTFGVDPNQAIVAAERVSLYANIFLPDLELRLSSQQRVEMENALQDLKEATAIGDSAKAVAARSTIAEIIAAYQGELI
ncbi:hypothetical protein C8R34_1052 [Nitrosomonas sp. Nm84]|uniref:hypothetical protein n=1 Tax=Nitrosomonas sp. Nm84 TaxID=200124 RepID=UPI000D75103D|nr:hypothetical protein [Nitrosomonas sp. Nm84]PXW89022.1 hypothetical protein C8R34_1052 [Nitrosomonas sp. Nm84]